MRRIALGLDVFLDAFALRHGADTWKQFAPDRGSWKPRFLEVMNDSNVTIFFNLMGVNVWPGVTRAARGGGGPTDWELFQIHQNNHWWPRIKWIEGDVERPNPFE